MEKRKILVWGKLKRYSRFFYDWYQCYSILLGNGRVSKRLCKLTVSLAAKV